MSPPDMHECCTNARQLSKSPFVDPQPQPEDKEIMASVTVVMPQLVASLQETQDWCSSVLSYELHVHHAAADKNSSELIYHLQCDLERPIPSAYLKHSSDIAFAWPVGGIWRITKMSEDSTRVWCSARKTTEMSAVEIEEYIKQFAPADDSAAVAEKTKQNEWKSRALFAWKMELGTWEKKSHWFLRDNAPPPASADPNAPAPLMMAKLLAGLTPVRAQLEVHSITSVDTVQQSFTADVTWEVTIPGITTISEESVFQEMVDLMEFKEEDFEFTNVTDIQNERETESFVIPAGRATFLDPFSPQTKASETVHHLRFKRRVTAVFNEEMSLYYFPFDQQKLTFQFDMTQGLGSSMPIAPAATDVGSFSVRNFKLGNIFKVVYGDKVFVGDVVDDELEKSIRFEIVLERFSSYYLTNLALPPAIIAYLCFTSWAPQEDNTLMDLGSRLQIVMTLVLTAVTFKNMVSALIPQVSYFTWLDRYIFFCFIVTCLVTFESAFYPLVYIWMGSPASMSEDWLLGFFFIGFTLITGGWAAFLLRFVHIRKHRSKILLLVNEYVRVIEHAIPNEHKDQVLRGYLKTLKFKDEDIPQIAYTKHGDQYVVLPSDSPTETRAARRRDLINGTDRKKALRALPAIQEYYKSLNPAAVNVPEASPVGSPVATKKRSIVHVGGKRPSKYIVMEEDDGSSRTLVQKEAEEAYKASYGTF